MRALLCLVLAMATMESVKAQPTYSLAPEQPHDTEAVSLRIDNESGCFRANNPTVTRDAEGVTFRAIIEDTAPCLPEWRTPRFIPLGSFAPGTYRVQVIVCYNSPDPDPCRTEAVLPLLVYGVSGTSKVPAVSLPSLLLLAFGLGVLARRSTSAPPS